MNKFMGNFSLFMIIMSAFVGVFANDIYITQSGTGLDLEITQDGNNNVFGTTSARILITGTDTTWTMSQVGDTNVISTTILGNTYTGLWAVTGNANDILFTCSAAGTGKCESVDVDVAINGNNTDLDIKIGASTEATDTDVTLDIDGDYNNLDMDIDGVVASATVTTITLDNSGAGTATETDNNIQMNYDRIGSGDSVGHELIYSHIGSGTVDILQSGIYDNKIDASITSTGADVDITQTD